MFLFKAPLYRLHRFSGRLLFMFGFSTILYHHLIRGVRSTTNLAPVDRNKLNISFRTLKHQR